MKYIPKEPVANKLMELLDAVDGTPWKKKDKIEILTGLMFMVEGLEVFDTEDRTTEIVKELEPIILGSTIGKDNFYCQHCKERVKRKDHYCRRCGFEFRRDEDAPD